MTVIYDVIECGQYAETYCLHSFRVVVYGTIVQHCREQILPGVHPGGHRFQFGYLWIADFAVGNGEMRTIDGCT